jgi:methylmalonyl-CoA/ethylmalonyl-CoA epimerase
MNDFWGGKTMKIHHIGYMVKRIEEAIEVFQGLGYEIVKETYKDQDRRTDICFMEQNGYQIELISPWKDSALYPMMKKYKNVAYHVCYAVSDIEESIQQLEKVGFVLFKSVAPAGAIGENAKVAFLMNAHIGMVELVEE